MIKIINKEEYNRLKKIDRAFDEEIEVRLMGLTEKYDESMARITVSMDNHKKSLEKKIKEQRATITQLYKDIDALQKIKVKKDEVN